MTLYILQYESGDYMATLQQAAHLALNIALC